MKRHCSSESLGANLAAICPNSTDEDNQENKSTREIEMFSEGLDEEEAIDVVSDKKRRLRVDQVRALEKNFEVENKLVADRKARLAQELGLQPRQVAVWFQNRRARWKTKQLERDYSLLKANYDGLKITFDKLQLQNQSLLKEFEELKLKISEDENNEGQKVCNSEGKMKVEDEGREGSTQMNSENLKCTKSGGFGEAKAGSTESDSSAILNEDNNNNNSSSGGGICSSNGVSQQIPHQFLGDQPMKTSCQFSDMVMGRTTILGDAHKAYLHEHNFFGEESCTNFMFCDDNAPSLHWYSMMSGSEDQDSLRLCFDRGIS